MIKTKGDILQAIPSDAYVRVKKCGLQTEIMYSTTHSRGGNTRKVGKDKYVIVDGQTGEVSGELNYKKSNSRIPPQRESIKDYRRITCEKGKYLAK